MHERLYSEYMKLAAQDEIYILVHSSSRLNMDGIGVPLHLPTCDYVWHMRTNRQETAVRYCTYIYCIK